MKHCNSMTSFLDINYDWSRKQNKSGQISYSEHTGHPMQIHKSTNKPALVCPKVILFSFFHKTSQTYNTYTSAHFTELQKPHFCNMSAGCKAHWMSWVFLITLKARESENCAPVHSSRWSSDKFGLRQNAPGAKPLLCNFGLNADHQTQTLHASF